MEYLTHLGERELEKYLRSFDSTMLRRGREYHTAGHVVDLKTEGNVIFSFVKGQEKKPYKVVISYDGKNTHAHCSCYVGYFCKHIAATLYSYQDSVKKNTIKLDYLAKEWVKSLIDMQQSTAANDHVLLFLISQNFKRVVVTTYIARYLQKGGLGKPQKFTVTTEHKKNMLTKQDYDLLMRLSLYNTRNIYSDKTEIAITTDDTGGIFEELLATNRCYYQNIDSEPLQLNEPLFLELQWKLQLNGKYIISHDLGDNYEILHLNPPWIINRETSTITRIETSLPDNLTHFLTKAPPIAVDEVDALVKSLSIIPGVVEKIPLPKIHDDIKTINVQPIPCLQISVDPDLNHHLQGSKLALGKLSFRYDKYLVLDGEKSSTIMVQDDNTLIMIPRNLKSEDSFRKIAFQYVSSEEDYDSGYLYGNNCCFYNDYELKVFFLELVPALEAMGFEITLLESFPYQTLIEPEEWYSNLNETSDYQWFEFEMGVIINDEKTNLLPILVDAIKNGVITNNKTGDIILSLDKGRLLKLPQDRYGVVMNTLKGFLTATKLDEKDVLKISRLRAAMLHEIEKAFEASKLRWYGAKKYLELGKKLHQFEGIQDVLPPSTFKTTLRPYQQHGLNWLQFLRQYDLGGILADDMGLGKTVQTLAHLSIEKKQKRLIKPALIIAPTSVIANWYSEIQQFAPHLSTLILHGNDRKIHFDKIDQYDIVITTYPLLIRDKDHLLEKHFYYIILDEAQTIKNSQAKMTQVVQQLKAEHRLCLSGTPFENHLGELWSIFNFLSPGLLGTKPEFTRKYRHPIERDKNDFVKTELTKVIKPFLLRRTKDEVVKELPSKTEIIESISLSIKQQDLYETIRLAMHDKVKKAIKAKGVEHSQIIILDALLKLRQVCCDPRLVNFIGKDETHDSAKLNRLLEMLPEMIEQGRRILLFSQFTSMLALIETELKSQNIDYVKLTGNTKDRITPVQQFQNKKVPLFLISLKAGGTGLNLTAADTVIHYDPWWNPAVESQATDRAHRIGQTNPVFVYKLITENTIEEKILQMQKNKSTLLNSVLNEQNEKSSLTSKEILSLFLEE